MQTNIREIYQQNILPLSDAEQLKLAALILDRVANQDNGGRPKSTGGVRELFGRGISGDPTGADNDKIDADLARTYMDTHDDE
jgi:hypothetical protein